MLAVEDVNTMDPDPWSTMRRPATWAHTKAPRRLMSCTRFHSSSVTATAGLARLTPWLTTMPSSPPKVAIVSAIRRSTWSRRAASKVTPCTRPPVAPMAATASATSAAVRPATKVAAPAAAMPSAMARPRPPPAPVAITVLPVRSNRALGMA